MTCENPGLVLGHALTPWWATNLFLGLSLRNQSIGLNTGVGICVACRSSSLVFQRPRIRCRHLLQSEAEVVEPCSELCSELRVRFGRHGRRDVLLEVGLEVGE